MCRPSSFQGVAANLSAPLSAAPWVAWWGGASAPSLGTRSAAETVRGIAASSKACSGGGAAGGTLGLAAGVHLANGRQGNFALDFLSTSAACGFGIGTVFLLERFKADATPEEQVELGNDQAIILLAMARRSADHDRPGRGRDITVPRQQPAGSVMRPLRDGRVALGVGVSF